MIARYFVKKPTLIEATKVGDLIAAWKRDRGSLPIWALIRIGANALRIENDRIEIDLGSWVVARPEDWFARRGSRITIVTKEEMEGKYEEVEWLMKESN